MFNLEHAAFVCWNARSIRHKVPQVSRRLKEFSRLPILAVTETWQADKPVQLPGYIAYSRARTTNVTNGGTRGGGVAIYIPQRPHFIQSTGINLVDVQSPLEAVACRANLNGDYVSIVCCYVPSECRGVKLTALSLQSIIGQCPKPVILCGDFNAHGAWGGPNVVHNEAGATLQLVLDNEGLIALNDGRPTYHQSHTEVYSSLDVTAVASELALKYTWEVGEDQWGSDHFPTFLVPIKPQSRPAPTKVVTRHTDWNTYRETLRCITVQPESDLQHSVAALTSSLADAMHGATITKTLPGKISLVPWWTAACTRALEAEDAARQRRRRHRHVEILRLEYRRSVAKCRKTLLRAKRPSCRRFGQQT